MYKLNKHRYMDCYKISILSKEILNIITKDGCCFKILLEHGSVYNFQLYLFVNYILWLFYDLREVETFEKYLVSANFEFSL